MIVLDEQLLGGGLSMTLPCGIEVQFSSLPTFSLYTSWTRQTTALALQGR